MTGPDTIPTHRRSRPRRGMAVILVLLLISVTLGLSYAAVRSELFVSRIQRNAHRCHNARHAAVTGLTMALKKMHTGAWAGVDTTLSAELNEYERFEVAYTTGDPSLSEGDDDWDDFPYRVTLMATGYAANPVEPDTVATYRVRAVVQLIPRALGQQPTDWGTIRQFTVYQYRDGIFEVNVPCRITGGVRAQEEIRFGGWGDDYWWPDWVRDRYFEDLETLRQSSGTDWRPFDGPLHLSVDEQEDYRSGSAGFLEHQMGIQVVDEGENPANINVPSAMATYRIYPGGKEYEVPDLPSRLENVQYEPDVEDNPLGFFRQASGYTNVYDNVRMKGTLVGMGTWDGDLHIYGENVEFKPVDLPPLDSTTKPVRLPTLALADDLRIYWNATGSIVGLVFAGDDVDIKWADQDSIRMKLNGCFVMHDFIVSGRNEWGSRWWTWWNDRYNAFMAQLGGEDAIGDFVTYLAKMTNLDPTPRIVFQRESATVDYHWQDFSEPVFVPHEDDEGLRWDLIDWTENP